MKELYTAPEMEVIRFAPAEKIASDLGNAISLDDTDFTSNTDHEGGGSDF